MYFYKLCKFDAFPQNSTYLITQLVQKALPDTPSQASHKSAFHWQGNCQAQPQLAGFVFVERFQYAPNFNECFSVVFCCFVSQTIIVGLSARPSPSLVRSVNPATNPTQFICVSSRGLKFLFYKRRFHFQLAPASPELV